MRVRAIKDLVRLDDEGLFTAVAEGLELIIKNVTRLWGGADQLREQEHFHAARVLAAFAQEESAKFLILIDAVRCPRDSQGPLANHLARFNDHLAKGLYAKASGMRPDTLARLQEYIDLDRDAFYLDGPNDVDWIFRNQVIEGREGLLYVDYVHHDSGHRWSDPCQFEELFVGLPEPHAVRTARALHAVGVRTSEALAVVAGLWRGAPLARNAHVREILALNRQTLVMLQAGGLLTEGSDDDCQWIWNEWQFPMYSLDLSQRKTSLDELRERQRNWCPEG